MVEPVAVGALVCADAAGLAEDPARLAADATRLATQPAWLAVQASWLVAGLEEVMTGLVGLQLVAIDHHHVPPEDLPAGAAGGRLCSMESRA